MNQHMSQLGESIKAESKQEIVIAFTDGFL